MHNITNSIRSKTVIKNIPRRAFLGRSGEQVEQKRRQADVRNHECGGSARHHPDGRYDAGPGGHACPCEAADGAGVDRGDRARYDPDRPWPGTRASLLFDTKEGSHCDWLFDTVRRLTALMRLESALSGWT